MRVERLLAVGGGGEQLDPVEQAEQRGEALADQALVVGQHHAYRAGVGSWLSRGQAQLDAEAAGSRRRQQLAAEQLGALAHAGQPVAASGQPDGDGRGEPSIPWSSTTSTVLSGQVVQLNRDTLGDRRGGARW